MVLNIVFLLFISFFSNQVNSADFYPEDLAGKMIKIALKDKNIVLKEKIEVHLNTWKTEPVAIYGFTRIENGEKFFAIFTQASGRYDLFDYLIVVKKDFIVEVVTILKYRSEHGGEVASKKWLQQFAGYSSGELRYGKEISALSGATISAASLVNDVPKVLEILKKSCD